MIFKFQLYSSLSPADRTLNSTNTMVMVSTGNAKTKTHQIRHKPYV